MSVLEWDTVLKSNLSSAFYLFRAAHSYLRHSVTPSFVCIGLSPADGVRAAVNVGAYAVAKLALQMFTRTLAAEVASEGIRVNLVAPGLIDNGHLPEAQRTWMAKRVPAGRLGHVEDVASAVHFLISDEARYINGATLAVSGGWDWLDRDATHDSLIHETFTQEVLP
jgi:3-oxoacyl-[acyl-carrier protein] reductase